MPPSVRTDASRAPRAAPVRTISETPAITRQNGGVPDLIISDYSLTNGKTGIDVIARLRDAFNAPIPAFLMSGDTNPEPLQEARASGFHLLHKPVDPMTLRAMVNRMLKNDAAARVRL